MTCLAQSHRDPMPSCSSGASVLDLLRSWAEEGLSGILFSSVSQALHSHRNNGTWFMRLGRNGVPATGPTDPVTAVLRPAVLFVAGHEQKAMTLDSMSARSRDVYQFSFLFFL